MRFLKFCVLTIIMLCTLQVVGQHISIKKDGKIIHNFLVTEFDSIIFEPKTAPDTIYLFALGNSFTDDALGQNVYEMFHEIDMPIYISYIIKGSCSLKEHLENIKLDLPVYTSISIDFNGNKRQISNVKISDVINNKKWTHISFQQVSEYSGIYDSYTESLDSLLKWVRDSVSSTTKIIFHQTWAYDQDFERSVYSWYENDQITMYNAIIECSTQLMDNYNIDILVPTGTAIQNARSVLGDILCRDGMHLAYDIGRYTAACTWVESLSGICSSSISFVPETIPESTKQIINIAVQNAISNPFSITYQ